MISESFRHSDMPQVFGIMIQIYQVKIFKVENNFKVNNNATSIESAEDIINGIDSVCSMIGAFSCRRIGQDEYDRKMYNCPDSDDENSNQNIDPDNQIFRSLIEGANHQVNQVHNAVNHVGKIRRHICLNMQYVIEKELYLIRPILSILPYMAIRILVIMIFPDFLRLREQVVLFMTLSGNIMKQ